MDAISMCCKSSIKFEEDDEFNSYNKFICKTCLQPCAAEYSYGASRLPKKPIWDRDMKLFLVKTKK